MHGMHFTFLLTAVNLFMEINKKKLCKIFAAQLFQAFYFKQFVF